MTRLSEDGANEEEEALTWQGGWRGGLRVFLQRDQCAPDPGVGESMASTRD